MSQKTGEVDYAEQELHRLGYDETIFSFDHVPDKKLLSDVEPEVTGVIVTNTENQRQKAYRISEGDRWSLRFLADVQAGEYGPPPKGLEEKPAA
jgi:hypothetical protein